jgi:hypothetical protein
MFLKFKKHSGHFNLFLLLICLAFLPPVFSGYHISSDPPEKESAFKLTIDNIMQGEELVGTSPTGLMWSYDSQQVYFRWREPGAKTAGFYVLNLKDLKPKAISPEEMLKSPPLIPPVSVEPLAVLVSRLQPAV